MRIAVVNNFFPPRVGGSSHLSDELARGYAAAGHEVLVITAAYLGSPAREQRAGMAIVRLPAIKMPKIHPTVNFDLAFTLRPSVKNRVYGLLDGFRPDVIHQHGQFFDLTWASGMWAKSRDVPVLLSVHTRLVSPLPVANRIFSTLDRTVVVPILRRYRPTVVQTDVLIRDYVRERYHGVLGGTVDIPVALDPYALTGGDGQRIRDELGLGAAPVICSLGHVIPLRNRVALVESLPFLREHVPDVKVLVVGGIYYPQFLKRAKELGVDDMIICAGAVPQPEVRDYMAVASLEAHDLQGFGLGISSLEAMAAGKPVVAELRPDHVPGVQFRSGENIVLVPNDQPRVLADAMAELLRDPELATKIGLAGQNLVRQHFAIDEVVQTHLRTLHDLVAANPTGRPK